MMSETPIPIYVDTAIFNRDVRTNPETCLHNIVLQVGTTDPFDTSVICGSCDSTISAEFAREKNYKYADVYEVWVHVLGKRDTKQRRLIGESDSVVYAGDEPVVLKPGEKTVESEETTHD
jgi:hypothetical protein